MRPLLFPRLPRLVSALLVACLGLALRAVPPRPQIPGGTFDVTTYGAVPDGQTDNTTAIQAALNAAKSAGGGTVLIPAGAKPYRCGPITVASATNVQVATGATLQALPFGTYPNSTTSPAHFISTVSGATNVQISGGGTIDGNGGGWWTAYRANSSQNRPRLIQFNHADTVLVTGVTLTNSPMFHVAFSATNNVTIDGVTITAPGDSPNTDALDPAGQHYLITNSTISVGDDNIAVKASSSFCGDITVTNCAFGTGHGVSIGGQTNVGLDGMVVDHCTFDGTTTALRMKADPTQGGPVQNVTYSNLTMTNVPYPFVFYSYYNQVGSPGATSGSSQTTPAKVAAWNATPPNSLKSTTLPTWKNITLSNITATGATGYSVIWGLPLADGFVANVTLNNVRITGSAGLEIYDAQNVQFTGTTAFLVPTGAAPVTAYNALAITRQPSSQTASPGGTVSFSIDTAGTSGVNGTAPTYQWSVEGTPLTDGPRGDGCVVSGATAATLTLTGVTAAEAGGYAVRVSNSLDRYDPATTTLVPASAGVTATSATAQLSIVAPVASALVNLSVRCAAGSGDQTLTVGFVTAGAGKPVLVRGIGPRLAGYGLTGLLADPQLALFTGGNVMAVNDNWGSAATAPAIAAIAQRLAFALPDGSLDSALLATLDNGLYSAQVSGSGATGIALAEIYDTTPLVGARLVNLSVRAVAGSGDATLTAGFVIAGSGKKRLLIRGVGPTLAGFGVSGTLPDPSLKVVPIRSTTVLATNDDWGSAATSPDLIAAGNQVGAFSLPDGSRDAALLLTLDPGGYTVQLTGATAAPGVALIEVYEVP